MSWSQNLETVVGKFTEVMHQQPQSLNIIRGISLYIPLIDHLNTELKNRFGAATTAAYSGLRIIPATLISSLNHSPNFDWKNHFMSFVNFYSDDLPNPIALDGEIELWVKYWDSYEGCCPDTIASTLKLVSFPGFENIKVALRILATLPSTSCECERSFSMLRRLKSYTRSTMVEDRINGLALMQIHPEIEPDIADVINKFCASGARRLAFL